MGQIGSSVGFASQIFLALRLNDALRPIHFSPPVQEGAAREFERGRLDVAVKPSSCLDYDFSRGAYITDHGTVNDHRPRLNVSRDGRTFVDGHRLARFDAAAKLSLNSQ